MQAFHIISWAVVVSQFEFGRDLGWEENTNMPPRELCCSRILYNGGCQGRTHCVELELVWESGILNFYQTKRLNTKIFINLFVCLAQVHLLLCFQIFNIVPWIFFYFYIKHKTSTFKAFQYFMFTLTLNLQILMLPNHGVTKV